MFKFLIVLLILGSTIISEANELRKVDNKSAVMVTTHEQTISVEDLLRRKEMINNRIDMMKEELKKINDTLKQLKDIGVE